MTNKSCEYVLNAKEIREEIWESMEALHSEDYVLCAYKLGLIHGCLNFKIMLESDDGSGDQESCEEGSERSGSTGENGQEA